MRRQHYNPRGFGGSNETYLKGSFGCNALWPSQITLCLQWADPDSRRRGLPTPSVSQPCATQALADHRRSVPPAQQPLPRVGDGPGPDLPDDVRAGAALEATHLLRHNGVFQYLTGLPVYPNPTTLRRFLLRMAPSALPKLRKLHDRLLQQRLQQSTPRTRFIFDLDSTVVVLYGKQEEARVGYKSHKRGRPSYHPLLCFEGHTKDFCHGELRPGDTHTKTGMQALLPACFAKLPPTTRAVVIRADKGFYDHKLIEWLEGQGVRFVVVARLT